MPKDKKIHVEFAPGCFDDWDGSQEELDALKMEIERMAKTGELEENSISLDDDLAWQALTKEEQDTIMQALEQTRSPGTRH